MTGDAGGVPYSTACNEHEVEHMRPVLRSRHFCNAGSMYNFSVPLPRAARCRKEVLCRRSCMFAFQIVAAAKCSVAMHIPKQPFPLKLLSQLHRICSALIAGVHYGVMLSQCHRNAVSKKFRL